MMVFFFFYLSVNNFSTRNRATIKKNKKGLFCYVFTLVGASKEQCFLTGKNRERPRNNGILTRLEIIVQTGNFHRILILPERGVRSVRNILESFKLYVAVLNVRVCFISFCTVSCGLICFGFSKNSQDLRQGSSKVVPVPTYKYSVVHVKCVYNV